MRKQVCSKIRFLFQFLKTSRDCGNTLNRPASDSRPLLWEKSTYFLSVRLAICLLEGFLTQSTCCCMCSQSVSPKKTVEFKCKCSCREKCFCGGGGGCLCAYACMCVWDFVWRTNNQQITSKTTLESCVYVWFSVSYMSLLSPDLSSLSGNQHSLLF